MKILRLFDSLKFVRAIFVALFAIFAFFVAPAHAATLPAGYTELEYLESTGTQYIDTNATLNTSTDNVEIVFQTVSDNIANVNINLFGARSTTTSNAYTLGVVNGGWRFGWGNSSPSFGTANTNKHTARIEHNNGVLKIDDTVIATSGNASITTPTTATLFAIQTNGNVHIYYGTFKIYSYKKWTNDILVQNFVPVRRDSDGVLGMYDLADSNPATAFHTNAGTGNFIAGEYKIKIATTHYNETKFAPVESRLDNAVAAVNTVVTQTMSQAQAIDQIATNKQTRPDEGCDAKYCLLVEDEQGVPHWYPIAGANGVAHALPAGYTELQYIESTGTQYINTNITGSTNAIIDMQGTPRTDDMVVFMLAPINATAYQNGFGQYQSSIASNFDIATRRVYNVSYTSNSMTVNGVNISNRYIANNVNLALFGSTSTNNNRKIRDAKLYSAKIYNNDTLLRNFIPAKNSNNEIGLYDMVSGQFFTNDGTGDFTAGPDM